MGGKGKAADFKCRERERGVKFEWRREKEDWRQRRGHKASAVGVA
jgi:hypothetical protein